MRLTGHVAQQVTWLYCANPFVCMCICDLMHTSLLPINEAQHSDIISNAAEQTLLLKLVTYVQGDMVCTLPQL